MPITVEMRDGISYFDCSGVIGADDLISAIGEWMPENPTRRTIYDMRDASLADLKARDFETVARFGAKYADLRGPNPRNAVLVHPGAIDILVLNAYRARQEIVSPVDQQIFYGLDAALAWLNGP